ncbi:MAG: DUF6940 family protein [Planctomycetia bacterium]
MMWTAGSEKLNDGCGLRFTIALNSVPASVADVLRGCRDDPAFRSWFNALLAAGPFTAFRWETPAVTDDTVSQPFEFVVLDSPGLARRSDSQAFAEHFSDRSTDVAVFPNLGGDAILIVPHPIAETSSYGHLAAFTRLAPESQRDSLWRSVGEAMERRIGTKPVWLSTAGAGVSWLHLRLDDRPKYYGYEPYRRTPPKTVAPDDSEGK